MSTLTTPTSRHKEDILDWLLNLITDNFCTFVHNKELQLCIDNNAPDGFMFNNMTFRGTDRMVFTCKPELEETAKEVWELKQKVRRDWMYLENYFKRVLARMTNYGQLYCYVPSFMHNKLDEIFVHASIGEKEPIRGMHPDESIHKLISFYVMTKLII